MKVPENNIADFVSSLAKQHGIKYVENKLDRLGIVFTELSGDKVGTDDTRKLLIRLKQANIISGKEMLDLLDRHLKEKRTEEM